MRLDIYITKQYPDITRSRAKHLIEDGRVKISGAVCRKPSHEVKGDEAIVLNVPPPKAVRMEPQDMSLEVLYEDADIIVVNKPAGLVVHPGAGVENGTLVNALLAHCKDLSGIGGELRPGIVHRLDKGTSGAMVVAKNDSAHLSLSNQFKGRNVDKRYIALVYGRIDGPSGRITAPIGRHTSDRKKMSTRTKKGRVAETSYTVKERFGRKLTLVDIKLGTGRTHQIRVHFSHLGHPLVGDDLYGGKAINRLNNKELSGIVKQFSRPFLHSVRLGFSHPVTGEFMEFTAAVPSDMEALLNELRNFRTVG